LHSQLQVSTPSNNVTLIEKRNIFPARHLAHACNPSYSGGRDQEDNCSKLARANSLQDPISKVLNTKRAEGVAQGVERLPTKCEAVSSNPSTTKKKKKYILNIISVHLLKSMLLTM
jgi:hypothetical protein